MNAIISRKVPKTLEEIAFRNIFRKNPTVSIITNNQKLPKGAPCLPSYHEIEASAKF